jgi:cell division protein FtsI/penicillin-binding protein 2
VTIACKTGTAEYGDPKGKAHAWFPMFAPAYNPEISITVLVEGGGEGSVVAVPIAKKVLEGYFK